MSRDRTVLSIDGGGIRGIIPAMVLDHLETRTGHRAADLFDLMVGTSTGGILALGLAQPDTEKPENSRFSARDLADLYANRGSQIFGKNLWRQFRSALGIFDESYSASPLEAALADYFDNNVLGDCRCPTIVTAYDLEARSTTFFKSFKPEHAQVLCKSAARATSAAPTFFEPAQLEVAGKSTSLIDGAVFLNSPVVSAYAEALKLFPGDKITVISLGTGELAQPISGKKAASWGKIGWMLPVLDCVFDGMSKAADYQMRLFLGERYQRFQLTLENATDALDDTTPENIRALFEATSTLIDREGVRLNQLIKQLQGANSQEV
jgi:patatin-like phospholipase/acyl hydrolase